MKVIILLASLCALIFLAEALPAAIIGKFELEEDIDDLIAYHRYGQILKSEDGPVNEAIVSHGKKKPRPGKGDYQPDHTTKFPPTHFPEYDHPVTKKPPPGHGGHGGQKPLRTTPSPESQEGILERRTIIPPFINLEAAEERGDGPEHEDIVSHVTKKPRPGKGDYRPGHTTAFPPAHFPIYNHPVTKKPAGYGRYGPVHTTSYPTTASPPSHESLFEESSSDDDHVVNQPFGHDGGIHGGGEDDGPEHEDIVSYVIKKPLLGQGGHGIRHTTTAEPPSQESLFAVHTLTPLFVDPELEFDKNLHFLQEIRFTTLPSILKKKAF